MTETRQNDFISTDWLPGWLRRLAAIRWLPYVLALLAAGIYLVQSLVYAHTLDSVLDEGAYLVKGYAFVSGQYTLYQDYGFWSNHMPLAFYIPGTVQAVFGPGLASGRYFSVILGMLMLLGIWVVTRRLGGVWWAALVLAGICINPAVVKMYSTAITQVLIACMLAWLLVLTLGARRPIWQLALGSALAAVMWMTRINLAPVLPLLVLYIFWQYGKKAGFIAAITGGLTLLALHLPFWPGILRMYAYWIPESLVPFLEPWQRPEATPFWDPDVEFSTRINSFFRTVRFHFLALLGVASAWFLWPRRGAWKNVDRFKPAVFLSTLFFALWSLHFWATMSKNYCAFCLEGYTAFFASLGWLLLVLTFASWPRRTSGLLDVFTAGFVLILASGIGFSTFDLLGRTLLEVPLPFGWTSFAVLLQNKFGILPRQGQYLMPSLLGFLAGLGVLGMAYILRFVSRRRGLSVQSFTVWSFLVLFGVGIVLTPTVVLGGGYQTFDCGGNVIQSYEAVGDHLAQIIPSGSRVYWKGGLSAAPLLYVPGVQIYPAQINGDYSYQLDGDAQALEKYGYWNAELADQWLNETDYVLVEQRYYRNWFRDWVDLSRFEELPSTPYKVICRDNSQIRIFKRLR
jgi:hypothetical protein